MSRVLGCVPNDATEDPSASTELRPLEVPQEPPAQEKSVTGAAVTAGCEVEPVHARPNRIGWARLLKRVLAMTSLEHQLVFAEACAVDIDRPPQRPCWAAAFRDNKMNIESDPNVRDGEADHAPDFAVLLRRSASMSARLRSMPQR